MITTSGLVLPDDYRPNAQVKDDIQQEHIINELGLSIDKRKAKANKRIHELAEFLDGFGTKKNDVDGPEGEELKMFIVEEIQMHRENIERWEKEERKRK